MILNAFALVLAATAQPSVPTNTTGDATGGVGVGAVWDAGWAPRESWCLSGHVQLTSEHDYLKAGESYFAPDGAMIIFQGVPRPVGGADPEKHYGMYIAPVRRDDRGAIVGLERAVRLSSQDSSNTCGWFHPTDHTPHSYRVLFGSTTVAPSEEGVAGYQRGTSRYSWQFPAEMEIVTTTVRQLRIGMADPGDQSERISTGWVVPTPAALWERDGYDAEGSWSPDGRLIVYTRLEPGGNDGDLWVYDTTTGAHTALVTEPGYDGGAFFSPDGRRICYRSDRRADKNLQLYIAELAFDGGGSVTGVAREMALTDNEHVNWAPFFTPDGSMLFYATSEVTHANYEVFAIDATGDQIPAERARVRITDARGFDGLPVFTADGSWMMWTAQRGARLEGEDRPSSQLWAARVDLDAVRARIEAAKRGIEDGKLEDRFDEYMPGS